jgi:hypothetical protein
MSGVGSNLLQVEQIRARVAEIDQGFLGLPGSLLAVVQLAGAIADIPHSQILSPSRAPAVCWVRYAVMHVACQGKRRSLSVVGRALGGRDHTTIIYGLGRARELLETDPAFRQLCTMLEAVRDAPAPAPSNDVGQALITGDRDLFPPGPLFQFEEAANG